MVAATTVAEGSNLDPLVVEVVIVLKPQPNKYAYVAEIRSIVESQNKAPRGMFVGMLTRSAAEERSLGQSLRDKLPYIRNGIPLVIVFRALRIVADKDILGCICHDFNDVPMTKLLQPSLEEAFVIQNQQPLSLKSLTEGLNYRVGEGHKSAKFCMIFMRRKDKALDTIIRVVLLSILFIAGRDHGDPLFHDYKVFLNPSTTDVVCTTKAEALAMGKKVVCANHPSNDFFKQFPNCRVYDDCEGFVKETCKALQDQPAPFTDEQRHKLSWEAATERFLDSAELDNTEKKLVKKPSRFCMSTSFSFNRKIEDASALAHYVRTGFVSKKPDGEQFQVVGLSTPTMKKKTNRSRKWSF